MHHNKLQELDFATLTNMEEAKLKEAEKFINEQKAGAGGSEIYLLALMKGKE
jgi:hypothetical protein